MTDDERRKQALIEAVLAAAPEQRKPGGKNIEQRVRDLEERVGWLEESQHSHDED